MHEANFVQILGPFLGARIFLLAGALVGDTLWLALLPAGLYLGIHMIEGETLTPMLLATRFTLNPVLVIVSLVFWFWMWSSRRDIVGANVGNNEDHLRPSAISGSVWAFSGGLSTLHRATSTVLSALSHWGCRVHVGMWINPQIS